MGIIGFFQRLFSGEGIVKAVTEFEEPIEFFGDFVTSFFAGVEEEEERIIERRVEAIPEPEEVRYRRKIVKSGKSKEGNRDLFALTFESNTVDRFSELKQAIEEEYEITLDDIDLGYDDFTETDRPPFVWDEIRTGKE